MDYISTDNNAELKLFAFDSADRHSQKGTCNATDTHTVATDGNGKHVTDGTLYNYMSHYNNHHHQCLFTCGAA